MYFIEAALVDFTKANAIKVNFKLAIKVNFTEAIGALEAAVIGAIKSTLEVDSVVADYSSDN